MNQKDLRKQLRNVIQEILPELLTAEVVKAIEKQVLERVTSIENDVKTTMREMTERQKDTLGYLVRQATVKKD